MRVCKQKSTGRIIGSQSHGAGAGDLQVLIDNAVAAGYAADDLDAVYMTDEAFDAAQAAQRESELTYAERRRAHYPPISDQIDALWKGGAEADAMRAIVMGVKARFPK